MIGMPKAVTTALHETLEEHPDVFTSPFKEPNYFCRDLNEEAISSGAYMAEQTSDETYAKIFSNARDDQIRMESTTTYVYSEVAPELIKRTNPACKALLILREPTSWVPSFYQQQHEYHMENLSIEDAYAISKRGETRELPEQHMRPSSYDYYRLAAPVEQVKRWKRVFGDDLLIATFKHVTKEWPEFRAELSAFLGIDDIDIELKRVNVSGRARLRAVSRAAEVLRPYQWRQVLGPLFKPLSRTYRRVFFPPAPKPEWRPPKADFVDRVREMERVTGLPLTEDWGYDAHVRESRIAATSRTDDR